MCYSFTNSKLYANFLGNRAPGGSYSYLVSWLKEQASEPLKFPDGLCKAIFDNSQKIGKTYLISGDNVVPTSVITSHLWLTLDPNSTIQSNQMYKPTNWMWEMVNNETEHLLLKSLTSSGEGFRTTRDIFITRCIYVVSKQHNKKDVDLIDETLKEKRNC